MLALLNLAVVPAFTVGVPLLIVRYYAFSDTALAVTQSAMSAGGLLGGVLAGAFAKRLFLRRGTAALWCITAVCALLGLAVLPCVPAAAGYIAVTALAFCMMAAAALFQILLFTAIQAHAPTGQTGPLYEPYHGLCLPDPAGRAGGVRAFVWPLCPVPCVLRRLLHRTFSKSRFFYKIMNASLPIY